MSSPYLFVYGTLRSGSDNEWARKLAASATLVGCGRAMGALFEIGSYPGMTPSLAENDWVMGELFKLTHPESVWPALDEYEGIEFERREVPVRLDGGSLVNAWVYYYCGDTAGKERIMSGDWLEC